MDSCPPAGMFVLLLLFGGGVALRAQVPAAAPQAQDPAPSSRASDAAPPAQVGGQPPADQEQPRRTRRRARTLRRETGQAPARTLPDQRLPRAGGPVHQTATVVTSVLAGYDENASGFGAGTGGGPLTMASGSTGNLAAVVGLRRGNARHELDIAATGNMMAYPGYIDDPALGGSGDVGGKTTIGRSLVLTGSQRVGYEPFFNMFSPGAVGASVTPTAPTTTVAGLFERRSWNAASAASADVKLGRSNSLVATYRYGTQTFTDDAVGNSRNHVVEIGYRRLLGSASRFRTAYRYSDVAYEDGDGTTLPSRSMRLDGGVEGDLRPSRNRTLLWEATAGAARVDALTTAHRLPYSAWVPVGSGRLGLMLSRMWELEGGYRRDFSLLQGVTDEVYATDTGTVTLNRRLSSSMEVKVGGSIENFRTPVPGGDAEILAYGTGVSWGYTLSGTTTLTTSYYYYRHHFSDTVVLPAGFPAQYDRHAVRVGLTVTWPFAQPRSTGGAR